MGNSASYVGSHLKRLLNRYNAQYRALTFLEKEKLPTAPRHVVPQIHEDPVTLDSLQTKDPKLEEYLKDIYVKCDQIPLAIENTNPNRPLPEYNETSSENAFKDPEQSLKGFCTLSDFFKLRSEHDDDPETYSAAAIAKNYNLDVKKVENVLKYFRVFVVYDGLNVNDTSKTQRPLLLRGITERNENISEETMLLSHTKTSSKDDTSQKAALNTGEEKDTVKATRRAVKN